MLMSLTWVLVHLGVEQTHQSRWQGRRGWGWASTAGVQDAGAAGIQSYVEVVGWREIGFIANANVHFVPVEADVTHSASVPLDMSLLRYQQQQR